MKTLYKRIISVVLCALLLCGVLPVGAFAQEDATADLPDIQIKNYRKVLVVPVGSCLIFHTTADAPDGYRIEWSTGNEGSEGGVFKATEAQYVISADLVRISDSTVVKSTKVETVYVLRGDPVEWCVTQFLFLYQMLFTDLYIGGMRHYYIAYEDNRFGIDSYPALWGPLLTDVR